MTPWTSKYKGTKEEEGFVVGVAGEGNVHGAIVEIKGRLTGPRGNDESRARRERANELYDEPNRNPRERR